MTTSSTEFKGYDQAQYWVAPARNFRSSARLHLQHFLVQNTLGYLLEPAVEKSLAGSQKLIVADLACGNGVWLTELHSRLAKNNTVAQLDGFDINPVNFPDPAFLPAGVTLKMIDILAESIPAELKGIYDVVHIRAFDSVIRNAEALKPVLTVASELLKPGGFLHAISTVLKGALRAQGIQKDWVDVLDTHLAAFGFRNTRLLVHEKRKQDFKGWTEDYLMVWEEVAALFPPKATSPDAPMTRETWIDLFAKGVKETEQGVVVHQGRIMTAIGQKPL
ncbi:hypothetical protein PG997_009087 [Apiospora hydei]|uniref:Methyltransferase domain-containing protein n=1 Tax=Apiospora hydei TaxID=1337664 RepID=A0ABR1VT35_9PEZI